MRIPDDGAWVHGELRKKGVTLQLLWVEYRDAALQDPQGRRPYQYSQFCERYNQFAAQVDVSMPGHLSVDSSQLLPVHERVAARSGQGHQEGLAD